MAVSRYTWFECTICTGIANGSKAMRAGLLTVGLIDMLIAPFRVLQLAVLLQLMALL